MAETGHIPSVAVPSRWSGSAVAPFTEPLFRGIWLAAVVSYTGTWMQNVGAAWLMTTMTMSPLMVGLVQAAMSVPVFLVVLPAGVLADMVDRRRLLLATQTWMTLVAAVLGVLTLFHWVTPWTLILFTALLGFGAVMNDPAWQAITPEIVSRENFGAAVALNSAGFNVARAVGPALGGAIVAAAGSGSAFLLNAASFLGVIFVLHQWKRAPHDNPHPGMPFREAMATGIRHARQSAAVRAVLLRTAVFSFFAIAVFALLPLIASPYGSVGYGLLLGCFGLGAIAGATVMPAVRRRFSLDAQIALSTLAFATVTFLLSAWHMFWLLALALFAGGGAWIQILATLNMSAQTCSPAWVRARSISLYLLILQGGMAAGSTVWGAVATHYGIARALQMAAAGLLLGIASVRYYRLHTGASLEDISRTQVKT
ncbi:MAG TPA: MFS transporter [Terriglobales bacterium]|nr:MFS transporter [Terriglobales bacterium]